MMVAKTYNSGYSQLVTDASTNPPICSLCKAERTGCPVLYSLWSYVPDIVARGVNIGYRVCIILGRAGFPPYAPFDERTGFVSYLTPTPIARTDLGSPYSRATAHEENRESNLISLLKITPPKNSQPGKKNPTPPNVF